MIKNKFMSIFFENICSQSSRNKETSSIFIHKCVIYKNYPFLLYFLRILTIIADDCLTVCARLLAVSCAAAAAAAAEEGVSGRRGGGGAAAWGGACGNNPAG